MDLDLLFACQPLLHEELCDSLSVVSLQLDDLSISLVVNDSSIATPALLEVSHELLEVNVVSQSLDDSDALPDSTLLELDMHHLLLPFNLLNVLIDDHLLVQLVFY